MFYTNLLVLLIVLLLFSTKNVPAAPFLPLHYVLPLFFGKLLFFFLLARRAFGKGAIRGDSRYFAVEQRFFLLAVLSFAVDVYLLDCKFFLSSRWLEEHFPSLVGMAGLCLFFLYPALAWSQARPRYIFLFNRYYTRWGFLFHNIKLNLPIILPWAAISLLFDVLHFLPLPFLEPVLGSLWGEYALFLLFFLGIVLVIPYFIRHMWNCVPMPDSGLRRHLENFLRRQKFAYAEILLWPLFEGRVLTAGVMGLAGRLRYILVTPALLEALTVEELEAVMAHEIGHIKLFHLFFYLLLMIGLGLLLSLLTEPVSLLLVNSESFYRFLTNTGVDFETGLAVFGLLPLCLVLLVYFRFVFGFFMRNFERQADLHVFAALGDPEPLIQSFEKIAWHGGNIRNKPSWHHFSLAQRIDYLIKCRRQPAAIRRHHLKTYGALLVFLVTMAATLSSLWALPDRLLAGMDQRPLSPHLELVLLEKSRQDPENPTWWRALGDLRLARQEPAGAISAYERALLLAPNDAETMNNLAWLLVTAQDEKLLDAGRALLLAQQAAKLHESGFILDTLAYGYWALGMLPEALATEERALALDPENKDFYLQQMKLFRTATWPPASAQQPGSVKSQPSQPPEEES